MKYEYEQYNYSPTDDEMIKDLQRVALLLDSSKLTIKNYKIYGKYNESTIQRRFGSWNNALKEAGIGVAQQFWTEEQLFENLGDVWRKKGSQPRRRDMDNKILSSISSGAYLRKYGKWSNAIQEFIRFVNQDEHSFTTELESGNNHHKTRDHKTKRDVNLRLRFKVLQRDNFKCCACGASPSKDPNVNLHVDHIIPWAKGGETELDNLQTLCERCNLGKCDIISDSNISE